MPSDLPSLAALAARISADETLPMRRRQDVASALRTVARALGRQPDEVPAHPLHLRERIAKVAPAAAGLSQPRWRNAVSLTRFALKHAGLAFVPGRYREPLAPAWETLYRRLETQRQRIGLSRLARYCSVDGISPEQVDDAVMARFLEDLRTGGLVRKPGTAHRGACRVWNEAAATISGWPQQRVAVPDYRDTYFVPWSSFPPSLKADIDAYLAHLAGRDPLADFQPLRATSVASRARLLHQCASAAVRQGHDPAALRTMRDLVALPVLKDALRFFIARALKRQPFEIAVMIRAAARHWVKVDAAHLDEIKKLCRRLNPGKTGLTEKNRERLRPFDDPTNVHALLTLPARLVAGAPHARKPAWRRALDVQTAVAVELLLMVPMRIRNLARLDIEAHLIRSRGGKVHLAIPGHEVKNGVAIEAELPPETVRLLDLYLAHYRPLLLRGPSTWLFPGAAGKAKTDVALREQIAGAVKRHTGLIVNPHLFRHIAAKVYLDANPGAYGVVRLLHGHKSVDTTTEHYCGLEGPAAMRHFDRHILKLRAHAAPVAPRRASKTK